MRCNKMFDKLAFSSEEIKPSWADFTCTSWSAILYVVIVTPAESSQFPKPICSWNLNFLSETEILSMYVEVDWDYGAHGF